jgi:hypothetical protein
MNTLGQSSNHQCQDFVDQWFSFLYSVLCSSCCSLFSFLDSVLCSSCCSMFSFLYSVLCSSCCSMFSFLYSVLCSSCCSMFILTLLDGVSRNTCKCISTVARIIFKENSSFNKRDSLKSQCKLYIFFIRFDEFSCCVQLLKAFADMIFYYDGCHLWSRGLIPLMESQAFILKENNITWWYYKHLKSYRGFWWDNNRKMLGNVTCILIIDNYVTFTQLFIDKTGNNAGCCHGYWLSCEVLFIVLSINIVYLW